MSETKTRANVAPPPSRNKTFLPESITSAPVPAANNFKSQKLVGMTFNMDQDWHKRFKMTAAAHGMDMKALLIEAFAAWEREQRGKS